MDWIDEPITRPELRRPPLPELAIFRIELVLADVDRPVRRTVDVRSDQTLDVLHDVIQAVFGWQDYHLHRFGLGDPFSRDSQVFLLEVDLDQGDVGVPETDVRIDEVLQDPGDELEYVYDYGDHWQLTVRLHEVRAPEREAPTAELVSGERAAPPEDSRGNSDEMLREQGLDPAVFDHEQAQQALRGVRFALLEAGYTKRLGPLIAYLAAGEVGEEFTRRARLLAAPTDEPDPSTVREHLKAFHWLLDRAVGEGIPLSAAGYLKPADVSALAPLVPKMNGWIGANNREHNARPLWHFRLEVQSTGLLRKYKGRLVLTKAGAAAQQDPAVLWRHLAAKLAPPVTGDFEEQARLLLLTCVATSAGEPIPSGLLADALTDLGWRVDEGRRLEYYHVLGIEGLSLLENTGQDSGRWDVDVSTTTAALARAALRVTQ